MNQTLQNEIERLKMLNQTRAKMIAELNRRLIESERKRTELAAMFDRFGKDVVMDAIG